LRRIDELRREEAAGDALLAMASEDKAALEKRLAVVTEGKAAVEQRLSMVMEESAASQRAAAAATQRADDLLQRLNQKDNVSEPPPHLQQMHSSILHAGDPAACKVLQ